MAWLKKYAIMTIKEFRMIHIDKASNIDAIEDATEILASYFEEVAAEMRIQKLTSEYLYFIVVEVNKALVDALSQFEEMVEVAEFGYNLTD